MTLNQIIDTIITTETLEDTTCNFYLNGDAIGHPIDFHSWRGAYNYLGVELTYSADNITPSEFLSFISNFEPGVYTGWKGGDNNLDFDTEFYIDDGVGTVGNCVAATEIVFEDNIIKIICEEDMF